MTEMTAAEDLAAKAADFINSEGFIIQSDTSGKVRYKAMWWVVDHCTLYIF